MGRIKDFFDKLFYDFLVFVWPHLSKEAQDKINKILEEE